MIRVEILALDKLESKIKMAAEVIDKLRSDNVDLTAQIETLSEELESEREKIRSLDERLRNLQNERAFDKNNYSQKESLIKSRLERVVEKLSILESRGDIGT
ncbi:MAG: hypothetical protein CO189_02915 [candidate division Zixibacteria bacterium CG_4_9_14_3_um_filter_46_8]|nr:MAG: hypothetical protein CO189_02915 [candidate division Zixibacteria bacterium CG_4_9_14_3_um_filter_46_8]